MLIGTPEKEIEEIQKGAPDDLPDIKNDLDYVGDDFSLQGTDYLKTRLKISIEHVKTKNSLQTKTSE